MSYLSLALWPQDSSFAFEFSDDEARDTFALCLGLFVDQRRQEADVGPAGGMRIGA